MKKIYKDDFNNIASIEKKEIANKKDNTKKISYVLTCYSFNIEMVYFLSIFESLEETKSKLKTFSCGKFKEVKQ